MKQDYLNKSFKIEGKSELLDEFQSVKSVETQPEFREVILRAESCCGCGCDEIRVRRMVDYDSELQDGDYVGSDYGSQYNDEILD